MIWSNCVECEWREMWRVQLTFEWRPYLETVFGWRFGLRGTEISSSCSVGLCTKCKTTSNRLANFLSLKNAQPSGDNDIFDQYCAFGLISSTKKKEKETSIRHCPVDEKFMMPMKESCDQFRNNNKQKTMNDGINRKAQPNQLYYSIYHYNPCTSQQNASKILIISLAFRGEYFRKLQTPIIFLILLPHCCYCVVSPPNTYKFEERGKDFQYVLINIHISWWI